MGRSCWNQKLMHMGQIAAIRAFRRVGCFGSRARRGYAKCRARSPTEDGFSQPSRGKLLHPGHILGLLARQATAPSISHQAGLPGALASEPLVAIILAIATDRSSDRPYAGVIRPLLPPQSPRARSARSVRDRWHSLLADLRQRGRARSARCPPIGLSRPPARAA